jgi:diaminopimelate epimerase
VTESLRIWKYHGTGNDFVMLVDLEDRRPLTAELVAALCDRHLGVGADGVIRVTAGRAPGEDFFMDYRNADGSLAEMCGNGIRCLGKLVVEHGLTSAAELDVGTRAGVKRLSLSVEGGTVRSVTVGMGPPDLRTAAVPMLGPVGERFVGEPFDVGDGRTYTATAVSMGNPHLVLFVDEDPAGIELGRIGPVVEHHAWFPRKTNVELARPRDGGVDARVWERGSGETMACGTGACAVLVAANEAGLVSARAEVRFPGGSLLVERTPEQVLLTGPAERVLEGTVDPEWLTERGIG